MIGKVIRRNVRAIFGASQFSRMQASGDCSGHSSYEAPIEDSSGRTEASYRTPLERFYEKWPNWAELKSELGLETNGSGKTIQSD